MAIGQIHGGFNVGLKINGALSAMPSDKDDGDFPFAGMKKVL